MLRGRLWGVLAAFVLAVSPSVAQADGEISEEARTHFRAGVAFLKDPDGERPEEAYSEFKVAYQLSKSPKVLGNLGICAMKLERDGEAIEAFTRYVMEVSDIDESERRQVNQDIATLKASSVKVTLKVDKPRASLLDTRTPFRGPAITNAYGPVDDTIEIIVRAGHHRIHGRSGSYEADWEFDAVPSSPLVHELHFTAPQAPTPVAIVPPAPPTAPSTSNERPPPSSPPSKVWPIVVTATGGALLAAGAITGLAALRRVNQLDDACPNDECPANFDHERATNDARKIVVATDILLLTGGIVTVGGLVWLWLGSGSSSSTAATAPKTTADASCTSNGCGAWVRFALP
jgi:hypothetical protein